MNKPLPTKEELQKLFRLDLCGVLVWRARGSKRWDTRYAGQPAGHKRKDGRIQVEIKGHGRMFYAHQIIWKMVHGTEAPEIDHLDVDGLNNDPSNLRECNHSLNAANTKLKSNNSSGFKGVSYRSDRGKWRARIMVERKEMHLGFFDCKELAHQAYSIAAIKHFGEFARAA